LVCIHAIGLSDTGHRCPWFAAGFNNGLLELLLVSPPAAARFLDFHSVHYRFWWTLSSLNTAQIYRWVRHPDTKRMVVILEEADYDAWLRASVADGRAFLRQFDAGNLRPSRPNVRSCEADGRLSPFSVDKPVGRGLARPVTC